MESLDLRILDLWIISTIFVPTRLPEARHQGEASNFLPSPVDDTIINTRYDLRTRYNLHNIYVALVPGSAPGPVVYLFTV